MKIEIIARYMWGMMTCEGCGLKHHANRMLYAKAEGEEKPMDICIDCYRLAKSMD